jgi:hypothetical protein
MSVFFSMNVPPSGRKWEAMLLARSRQHLFSTFSVDPGVALPGGRRGKLCFRLPRVNTFFNFSSEPDADPARRQEGETRLSRSPRQHLFSTFSVDPGVALPVGRRGKLCFRFPRVNTFFNFSSEPGVDPARRQEGETRLSRSPRQHLFSTLFRRAGCRPCPEAGGAS